MNSNNIYLLFIFICIPVRLLYAILINNNLNYSFFSVFIGLLFIYRGLTWNGEKGIFGDVLWWNKMRFIHGIIYILSYKYPKLLYLDVLLGFSAKTHNYLLSKIE